MTCHLNIDTEDISLFCTPSCVLHDVQCKGIDAMVSLYISLVSNKGEIYIRCISGFSSKAIDWQAMEYAYGK